MTYAGSIYKCIKDNGNIVFTDKPCGKMKGKLIHQETKAESKAMILKRKVANINNLIRLGKNQPARKYAEKHQLEEIYREETKTYNLYLEQQVKQQQLATQKQNVAIKEQQLQIQQQSLVLQKQQLEQQKQQLKVNKSLASVRKKRYYPYLNTPIMNYCQGTSLKCGKSVYKKHTTFNRKNINKIGRIQLQAQDKKAQLNFYLHANF